MTRSRTEPEDWETVERHFAYLMSKIAKRKLTVAQAHEFNRELLQRQRWGDEATIINEGDQ